MSKSDIIIIAILTIIILLLLGLIREFFLNWIQIQWLTIIFAFLLAFITAIIINYFVKKYSDKSMLLQTTVTPPPNSSASLAKLILKEKNEFIIKEYERVFGREDFVGVLDVEDLHFIGKTHFKITKKEDGFYIKDLNSKNGTKINNKDIKGHNSIKLENEDNILVANVLNVKYVEE